MDQPRDPPAPITMQDIVKRVRRLRRDSPVSFVRTPPRSYGYVFLAPPGIRGCLAVTRPARVFQLLPRVVSQGCGALETSYRRAPDSLTGGPRNLASASFRALGQRNRQDARRRNGPGRQRS